MKIFLDANVLVAVVNREYPVFTACAKILSLADRPEFTLVTSTLNLAITWYFAEKKKGTDSARKNMELLLQHLVVAPCGPEEAHAAIQQINAHDFEDALQYFSALHSGCDHIVTSNTSDFFFADLPVSEPDHFFRFVWS